MKLKKLTYDIKHIFFINKVDEDYRLFIQKNLEDIYYKKSLFNIKLYYRNEIFLILNRFSKLRLISLFDYVFNVDVFDWICKYKVNQILDKAKQKETKPQEYLNTSIQRTSTSNFLCTHTEAQEPKHTWTKPIEYINDVLEIAEPVYNFCKSDDIKDTYNYCSGGLDSSSSSSDSYSCSSNDSYSNND